jgi:hypothetical protein
MIYHDLTSKGGGMPMRTGIQLSARVLSRQLVQKYERKTAFRCCMEHLILQPVNEEVRYADS